MNLVVPIFLGLTFLGSALLSLPTLVTEWGKRGGGEVIFSAELSQPVVALTIDDGPSPETPAILELLAEHDARATFFVLGEEVQAHPGLTARIVEEGHELGHHMMEDLPSRSLPEAEFEARFEAVDALLQEFGGSSVFRPGSGWYDDRMVRFAAHRGYRTILGSVYPFDAQLPWPGFHSWYVLQSVAPGAIVVLHEGQGRGERTVEALGDILSGLTGLGYRVVGVSELLALEEGEAQARRRTGDGPGTDLVPPGSGERTRAP